MEEKKLVRSENDKVLVGVCGGLAKYLGIDSSLLRIIFVVATIFGVGSPILIYGIMAIIMPKDDSYFPNSDNKYFTE